MCYNITWENCVSFSPSVNPKKKQDASVTRHTIYQMGRLLCLAGVGITVFTKNSIAYAKTPQPGGIRETPWNSKKKIFTTVVMPATHFKNFIKIHEQQYSIKSCNGHECVVLPWQ